MDQLPLQVTDAVALINQTLDYAFPTLVIEGEVSGYKVNQGKFVFFDIKDDQSTLGCFMMVFQLRIPLEDGMRVQVVATPKLTAWGKFSLTVREVRPLGEGSLKRAFELLHAKLEKEGLFSIERKRLLPAEPARIALVSSTQAAGYTDFVTILNRRWGGVRVDVAHTQVQGSGAADQIIRAIEYFNEQEQLADVLVIVRGGGSADDLSTFNDEQLVRAIAASRIPTVVGVGHEVDHTLADMAADVRAATPTDAAQLLVPDRQEYLAALNRDRERLLGAATTAIDDVKETVKDAVSTLFGAYLDRVEQCMDMVAEQRRLLAVVNPRAALRRGYAIVRGDETVGGILEIERIQHIVTAEVVSVRKK